MKAFEARQKSIKNQFEWIEKKLKKAIEKGKSQIIVEKTPLYEEVVEKLLDDGFDILIIQDPVGAFTRISMLASEEGKCGRFDYVPINWEFDYSDEEDDEDDSEDCNVQEETASKEEEIIDTPEVIEESNDEEVTSEAATGEEVEPEQC